MKKILSLFCTLLIAVSLFAVGVSAAPLTAGTNGGFILFDGTSAEGMWSSGTLEVRELGGKSAVALTNTGTADAIFCFAWDPADITSVVNNGGYVEFKLYVADPDVVIGGQLELTSSNASDVNEVNWGGFGTTMTLVEGWNTIKLNFSEGTVAGGDPNYTAMNYFRLYLNCYGDVELGLADFYLTTSAIGTPVTSTVTDTTASGSDTTATDTSGSPSTSDTAIAISAVALVAASCVAIVLNHKKKH